MKGPRSADHLDEGTLARLGEAHVRRTWADDADPRTFRLEVEREGEAVRGGHVRLRQLLEEVRGLAAGDRLTVTVEP